MTLLGSNSDNDIIFVHGYIKLSLSDRIRVLVGRVIRVNVKVFCENKVGKVSSEMHTTTGRLAEESARLAYEWGLVTENKQP